MDNDGGGNDDGNFNPCECIWNHEFAMRRLLNLLRQNQQVCTDTQCFDDNTFLTRLEHVENVGGSTDDGMTSIYFLVFLFIVASLMFVYAPNNRANDNPPIKKKGPNNENGSPPAPPPID